MLWMKAWLETRWRLGVPFLVMLVTIALNYGSRSSVTFRSGLPFSLAFLIWWAAVNVAGSGVKSQAPIGFPEGLAGSTIFTATLPVSRLRLLAVRSGIGLLQASGFTLTAVCLAWSLFPGLHGGADFADLARFLLALTMFMTVPYYATVFFGALLDDPLSMVAGGFSIVLLFWVSRHLPAPLNIFRAWWQDSPLATHRLPRPQMAVSAALAAFLFLATLRVVERQEY